MMSFISSCRNNNQSWRAHSNEKDMANMLWTYAKVGWKSWSGLEGLEESLSGTFNLKDMANTLWAYATMGQEPGERLMRKLEGRAESLAVTFNLQIVTNRMWTYAKTGQE